MSSRRTMSVTRPVGRAAVGATALAWVLTGPAAAGLAAADDPGHVTIQNTETVQVYTNASGKVDSQRIYEQLVLTGHGDVSFSNPVSTDSLRNLDGFSGFDVKDGAQQISTTVDGQERMRSLSDFDGTLPLSVSVTYTLDGKEISPRDVVGKSGELEVSYHVENTTGRTEQLQVDDGRGGTVTRNVDVVVPMVGSLVTVLPSAFTDVTSQQANIAGDGRGGTKMTFLMTLVPPIGGPSTDFGYTAHITDGVIPDATMSALPVDPMQSPSLKKGADAYESGTETGTDLTAGATKIDTNLLKLRDGASQLTVGLMKLYKGSSQLSEGLVNDAVPGTAQLADGSTQLSDGADRLYAGSGDLVGGIHQIRHGTDALATGTSHVRVGAAKLRHGASDLNAGAVRVRSGAHKLRDGVLTANDGAKQVDAGAGKLADGLLQAGSQAPALIDGLKQVSGGLDLVDAGLTKMYDQVGGARGQFRQGIDRMIAGIGKTSDGPTASLLGGLNAIRAGLSGAKAQLDPAVDQQLPCAIALLNEMANGTAAPAPCLNPQLGHPHAVADPTTVQNLYLGGLANQTGTLTAELKTLRDELAQQVIPGLTNVMCGLDNTVDPGCPAQPGILQGVQGVDQGITTLIDGVQAGIGSPTDTPADQTLRGGVNGLQKGVHDLLAGADSLLGGLNLLSNGAQSLAAGTSRLADGTQRLADGSVQLADGTVVLADGTRRLADGTVVLADGTVRLDNGAGQLDDGAIALGIGGLKLQTGAGQLADGSGRLDSGLQRLLGGLTSAADGSTQLRAGLQKASGGAPQVSEGATKLSKKGTSKLVDKGSQTTVEYGVKYAQIEAGAQRAHKDGMAFGAPSGAVGLTAYTFEIRGEDGEGSRNWHRGLAAVGIFGLGVGIYTLRRRFV